MLIIWRANRVFNCIESGKDNGLNKGMIDKELDIIVAIPCYNEEIAIGKVVKDFKKELPGARVIVFDNNSSDRTIQEAQEAGAEIFHEFKQGKGNVVQRIFNSADANILVLVDGDDTYFAKDVHKLIDIIKKEKADMAVGRRIPVNKKGMSKSHGLGNKIICWTLNLLFKTGLNDILSGYRVFSKNFYSNIPILSDGFEIETELTLQALERGFRVVEVSVDYKARPMGSSSKIREFSDGSRIISTIVSLFRDYRPMAFFSALGLFFIAVGIILGVRVVIEFVETGLVPRLPTAILSITFIILGFTSLLSGLTVSTVNRRHRELENILKKIRSNAK